MKTEKKNAKHAKAYLLVTEKKIKKGKFISSTYKILKC